MVDAGALRQTGRMKASNKDVVAPGRDPAEIACSVNVMVRGTDDAAVDAAAGAAVEPVAR
jgi:hypothetical protein